MEVTAVTIKSEMLLLLNLTTTSIANEESIERSIRATFGFDPSTVALVWNMLVAHNVLPRGTKVKYLLYMCSYFKIYATLDVHCRMFKVTYPTFSSWVWFFAKAIANLNIVSHRQSGN
jgi:hypothetical protein